MLDESALAEARLITQITKLAPRFVAKVLEENQRGRMARIAIIARPYLISAIAVQLALGATEWLRLDAGDGIPTLVAFTMAVTGVTRFVGILPGLFCAATSIVTTKLFFVPPLYYLSIDAGASNRFGGIAVALIATALARPAYFDDQIWRRLRRIKEAIRNTRSSSTGLPRPSSPMRNS